MSARQPRRVTILGSTGSVGAATADLIAHRNNASAGAYEVIALTARANVDQLAAQARRLKPKFVAVAEPQAYKPLKDALAGLPIDVAAGAAAVEEASAMASDWVMASIMGAAGLRPTIAAVSRGATVALANKECLVCAGDMFMDQVRRSGTQLLPVDSEHNAVFQVFDAKQSAAVESITLTASGGPFLTWTAAEMAEVTATQACKHPNYAMGAKISVDSATLMNKGLELIEAHHLFGMVPERLHAVIHPQQIVHCLVEYMDGSVLAQLASPDMRTPIAYALGYPDRISAPRVRLDLAAIGALSFETPDMVRFPCLGLAQQALRAGGCAPTILNAANEVAVEAFLSGRIAFPSIARVVESALAKCEAPTRAPASVDEALAVDAAARESAVKHITH